MSEYWKSTPNYWCKFCKTYVRDTKFARQQHDATGRHQSNIQRSLRTLHRDQERGEREKQRAKDEVARLNGVVVGAGSTGSAAHGERGGRPPPPQQQQQRQATLEDRKRQMQQLADMGVAVPEEFRRDMAIAGEWQVVSETPVSAGLDGLNGGDAGAKSVGVRKRKLDAEEEGEALGESKPQWGSSLKTYPGSMGPSEDFDSLLRGAMVKSKPDPAVKEEGDTETAPGILAANGEGATAPVKMQAMDESAEDRKADLADDTVGSVPASSVVFKKRKKKT